jgi:hypothetical protein
LLLLLAALGYLRLQRGDSEVLPELEARQASYVLLLSEGRRLLAAGDPAAAAVLFQTAEGVAEDPTAASRLRAEAVRQAADLGTQLQLATARDDLQAGRYQAAIDTARDMLGEGSGREKALQVLAEVQQALADSQRRAPRSAPPPTPAQQLSLRPHRLAPLAPPPAEVPELRNRQRATLVVNLRSEAPAGVLTVWAGERALVQEKFSFYSGGLLSRQPAVPGTWSRELILSPGDLPLRILVAREGQPADVRTMQAQLPPGGRTVLAIALPASGVAEVTLE